MREKGFGLLAYLIAGIVLAGLIGTGVYKVKQWGANEVRAEWAEANRQQRKREAAQFGRWNKAAGKTMAGLVRRRQAEKELFLMKADFDAETLK